VRNRAEGGLDCPLRPLQRLLQSLRPAQEQLRLLVGLPHRLELRLQLLVQLLVGADQPHVALNLVKGRLVLLAEFIALVEQPISPLLQLLRLVVVAPERLLEGLDFVVQVLFPLLLVRELSPEPSCDPAVHLAVLLQLPQIPGSFLYLPFALLQQPAPSVLLLLEPSDALVESLLPGLQSLGLRVQGLQLLD
jgi:hypothetical protein